MLLAQSAPKLGSIFRLCHLNANTECIKIFLKQLSEKFNNYKIILSMDSASWHTGKKAKTFDNIVPLFQPPYSAELNSVETLYGITSEKMSNFKIELLIA